MIVETILSPIKDEKMNSHLNDSEIWKNAFHLEEVTEEIRKKYPKWYLYKVKFDGVVPIQMTKFQEL